MTNEGKSVAKDGRRARSERSKRAIIEACQTLMLEGNLVPTAQTISDKAGVPIRTFFRHYPDMGSLFLAVDESLKPGYVKLFEESIPTGSLKERVKAAIELHAKSYEENKAVIAATKAQLWRYEVLQNNYSRVTQRLRKDLEARLPELKNLDQDTREAIDALASVEMWVRLRDQQNLSRKQSMRIIRHAIELLLSRTLNEVADD